MTRRGKIKIYKTAVNGTFNQNNGGQGFLKTEDQAWLGNAECNPASKHIWRRQQNPAYFKLLF